MMILPAYTHKVVGSAPSMLWVVACVAVTWPLRASGRVTRPGKQVTHCDWQGGYATRDWLYYVSASSWPLTQLEVMWDNFTDVGGLFEDGLTCDPALFFPPQTGNYTTASVVMTSPNFTEEIRAIVTSLPDYVTMLNVTFREEVLGGWSGNGLGVLGVLRAARLVWRDCRGLRSLGARRAGVTKLPDRYLSACRSLVILDLSHNGLTALGAGAFHGLYSLALLVLNGNRLATIHSHTFCGRQLNRLYSLNLQGALTTFPEVAFTAPSAECGNLTYVMLLRMSGCTDFGRLPPGGLARLTALRNEIQIARSGVTELDALAFQGLGLVPYVFLPDNLLRNIPDNGLTHMVQLKELLLQNNWLEILKASWFANSSRFALLDASNNRISAIEGAFSAVGRPETIIVADNLLEVIGRVTFSGCSSLRKLVLARNQLHTLEAGSLFGLHALRILDLSGNRLTALGDQFFRDLTDLRELYLRNNMLEYIDGTALLVRSILLQSVSIGGNSLRCDCALDPLRNWLAAFSNRTQDSDDVMCYADPASARGVGGGKPLSEADDLCAEPNPLVPAVGALVAVLCVILVISSVLYRFRFDIRVLVYAKYGIRIRTPGGSGGDAADAGLQYDAFVSYSSHDETFILRELMPRLEGQPPYYRLCLHFRDFAVGAPIAENIVQAVDSSRRTVLVVSRHFLLSEWCRYEFQMAHHKVLSEGGRRAVVVILDPDLRPANVADRALRSYMTTHTYLAAGDRLFWEKLRFALPGKTPERGQQSRSQQGQSELGQSQQGQSELGQSEQGQNQQGQSELGQSELGQSQQGQSELGQSQQGQSEV